MSSSIAGKSSVLSSASSETSSSQSVAVIRVPCLDEDIHDLGGLAEFNRYLFASGEEGIELAAGRA